MKNVERDIRRSRRALSGHVLQLAILLCIVDILICTDDKVSYCGASDSAAAT